MPKLIAMFYLSWSLIPVGALAAEQAARQDVAALAPIVQAFLESQAGRTPGAFKILVTPPDPRLDLPACPQHMEVFLPAGARLKGRVTVGVRCLEPNPWTLYVQAQISALIQYLAAAAALAPGHVLAEPDLMLASGEPGGAADWLTDKAQAIGHTLAAPVPAGAPIRPSLFRKDWIVRQGQAVRLSTAGEGFRISVGAKAMTNAGEGEPVQVKTKSGRVLNGIARAAGVVEIVH